MTPIPDNLVRLRAQVAASYRWWNGTKKVTPAEMQAMSETARKNCRYEPDMTLVAELVTAERSYTATFPTNRPKPADTPTPTSSRL